MKAGLRKVELRTLIGFSDMSPRYALWMNDPEVTRFIGVAGAPQSLKDLCRYVERCLNERDTHLYLIVVDGAHVGNAKLVVQPEHKKGIVSLVIGEKGLWGQGVGTAVVRLIIEGAFKELSIRKLEAGFLQPNLASYRLFVKCGFHMDGVHTKDRYCEGDYVDAIYMSLFRDEWELRNVRGD